MAIDTSKAFGQSYMEGFRETFKPKESPFVAASQKIADQLEAAKLKKEANQTTINEMYGRVNVPTGTQMYGDDYAKAKEMTEFLTNEATLEKYAESPEMQREYARLVQQANAFVKESQDYYKTTYGTSLDPQKGNYLGYVARQNSPNYYENQGQQDNRSVEDYDKTFALLDTPSHDTGSFSVENGQFVFTQGGQTKTLSDVDHTNIDVFMPNLEQTAFTNPSDFYQKNSNLINNFSKEKTVEFVSGKIIGNKVAEQDALKSYNANHPEAKYTVEDLATPEVLEAVISEYAEAVNDLRTPPKTTTKKTSTTKKKPSVPRATYLSNGGGKFIDVTNQTGSNKLVTTAYDNMANKVIGLKMIGKDVVVQFAGGIDDVTIPLAPENPFDELTNEQRIDRVRLEEYLNKVFGEGGFDKVIAELSDTAEPRKPELD